MSEWEEEFEQDYPNDRMIVHEVEERGALRERERIIELLERINSDDTFRDYHFGMYGDDFKAEDGFSTLIALIKGENE